MIIDTCRATAALDATQLKDKYLLASGSSKALAFCEHANQAVEKQFAQSMKEYYKGIPYSTTREGAKAILAVLISSIGSNSWYENECHEASLGIALARHISFKISPSGLKSPLPPVRLICFDMGVPFDFLSSLLTFAKTEGNGRSSLTLVLF